jgi:hypothetical protein
MTSRAAPGKTVASYAGRAAAAALLLVLGSAWTSAAPGPLAGELPREVNVTKPPHDGLRIRWSATVHEEGGEFLVSRQGLDGYPSVVARVRPRGDGRYAVAERGPAGSWTYKLRYRDRHGREYVLATIQLTVERLDGGPGILTAGVDGQPLAVRTAAVLPMPAAEAAAPRYGAAAAPGRPLRQPPTPPP